MPAMLFFRNFHGLSEGNLGGLKNLGRLPEQRLARTLQKTRHRDKQDEHHGGGLGCGEFVGGGNLHSKTRIKKIQNPGYFTGLTRTVGAGGFKREKGSGRAGDYN